jgi:hypothetical protein
VKKSEWRAPPERDVRCKRSKETGRMFDLAMIALGCASFAFLILYTYACDRM